MLGSSSYPWAPNKSFKPNLLRYSKSVAEKACHAFASSTQVGLTQVLGAMRIIATIVLVVLSSSAYGSRPYVEGDAIACIRGGQPVEAAHTVSFNNEKPVALTADILGSLVRLEASKTYTATFKAGDSTVQEITFSFKDYPTNGVCLHYDNANKAWSIGQTVFDLCHSCLDNTDGT